MFSKKYWFKLLLKGSTVDARDFVKYQPILSLPLLEVHQEGGDSIGSFQISINLVCLGMGQKLQ